MPIVLSNKEQTIPEMVGRTGGKPGSKAKSKRLVLRKKVF